MEPKCSARAEYSVSSGLAHPIIACFCVRAASFILKLKSKKKSEIASSRFTLFYGLVLSVLPLEGSLENILRVEYFTLKKSCCAPKALKGILLFLFYSDQ